MPQEIEVEAIGTILAYAGTGTDIESADGWINIDKLLEIEPQEEEADDIQTTHFGTTGHTHTFQAGLADPGEVSFVTHHKSAQHTALRALYRVLKPWRITYPNNDIEYFMGYLKTRGATVELEGLIGRSYTIKVSGATEFDPAAGSGD